MKFHMRRSDKEIIDPAALNRILAATEFVTLAMNDGDESYIVSLNHYHDPKAGCIYFHSASEGKKIVILRRNPKVWGQALINYGYREGKCSDNYASVVFKGQVEWVVEEEEKRRILTLMAEKLDKDPAKKLIVRLKSPSINERLKMLVG